MNVTKINNVSAYSAALYINVPLNDWTPAFSYIVCRGLVDKCILPGKAVIGILRERYFNPCDVSRPSGYSVKYSNYAWIDAGEHGIFDPCKPGHLLEYEYIYQTDPSGSYFSPVEPLMMAVNELPTHYSYDEIYPVNRGLHKEVFSRLLGFDAAVSGLTMTEVAYISALPLDVLGRNSKLVYEFLIKNNLSQLIPLKNARKIFPRMAYASPHSFRKVCDLSDYIR